MGTSRSEIDMSEFSSATGHALAHFLYTGQYGGASDSSSARGTDALRSTFEVYAAASKYQLNGLREKAQEAIETTNTDEVKPTEVLTVIKETYPLPNVGDVWLRAYTKGLLDASFTDVASFMASDLMAADHAESTMSITEMLLRAVINSEKERREQAERDRIAAELAEKEAREREEREAKEAIEREEREREAAALEEIRLAAEREAAAIAEKERQEREAQEQAEQVARECEAAEQAEKEAKDQAAQEQAEAFAKECEAAELAEKQIKDRQAAEVAERDAKLASLYAEREALEHKQRIGLGRLFGKLSKKEKLRLEIVRAELVTLKASNKEEAAAAETDAATIRSSKELEKVPATATTTPATDSVSSQAPGFLGKGSAAECAVQTTSAWPEWGHSKASRALGFST